ncbi:substrate-binding domain-containing protein [Faecalicatena faecalis]|nr:substrate-binding domain-containing protein [Faecalicatena faecalis]
MKNGLKKLVSFGLVLSMVVVMAVGCGSDPDTSKKSSADTDTKSEGTSKDDKVVVGVSLLNSTHVFYNNIQKGLESKADELGWDLLIQDAAADANKQLSQVQDFITQGVDAIIICPTNSAGSKSMVELADEAGIPVFTMDIQSDGEVVSHVATDNYTGGQLAAEYMIDKILTDKKGDAAVITYSEIEACIQREKGFTDYVKENAPDINVVDIQNYSGDQQKAADVMQNMLLKYENIDVVFAVGDPAAIGALSSIDAAGKDTKIIGYDGNPEGVEAIKSGGNWVADVAQDPEAIANETLEAVKTKLDGGTPEKQIKIAPYIIDKENAE